MDLIKEHSERKVLLSDLRIISIKKFNPINFWERLRVKRIIDKNYELYYDIRRGYNFPIEDNDPFFSKLYVQFLKKSSDIFGNFNLSPKNSSKSFCYRGNKREMGERKPNWWHNHINSSTINSVYYLQVFNDGISFKNDGKVYDYLPENDELLIFPADLSHAAQPNTLQKYRYSVNMEITTVESTSYLFDRVFKDGFS